jgi:hypothetical protein
MSARPSGVVQEHAVLCRHLGGVQDRVSKLMQEKDMALKALASEVVRLRGQLVVAHTSRLWGMPTEPTEDLEAARKVICQTGCAGHAHPWLSEDGQCRRSGRVCDGGLD